jgi:hypothetical protein
MSFSQKQEHERPQCVASRVNTCLTNTFHGNHHFYKMSNWVKNNNKIVTRKMNVLRSFPVTSGLTDYV